MAFTFRSPNLTGHIDEVEAILFEAIPQLGLKLPIMEWLHRQFYESPTVASEKVGPLRNEALTLMRALARDAGAVDRVRTLQPPAAKWAPIRAYDIQRVLAILVVVCDDALESGAEVRCLSD